MSKTPSKTKPIESVLAKQDAEIDRLREENVKQKEEIDNLRSECADYNEMRHENRELLKDNDDQEEVITRLQDELANKIMAGDGEREDRWMEFWQLLVARYEAEMHKLQKENKRMQEQTDKTHRLAAAYMSPEFKEASKRTRCWYRIGCGKRHRWKIGLFHEWFQKYDSPSARVEDSPTGESFIVPAGCICFADLPPEAEGTST